MSEQGGKKIWKMVNEHVRLLGRWEYIPMLWLLFQLVNFPHLGHFYIGTFLGEFNIGSQFFNPVKIKTCQWLKV